MIFIVRKLIFIFFAGFALLYGQESEEPVQYYQMEPLDDSLFLKIQQEVFIDPPDPKAEIIVDLRDNANQTITIKGALYPFLAFTPETRAKIITFPFKINLQESISLTSVFTDVAEKMKFTKLIEPPTRLQISSTQSYINPYIQIFGGERFGVPIKKDIGISFGMGTPYSGPLETGFVEMNFHILGLRVGGFNSLDGFTELKKENNHNNLYTALGYQLGYVIPLGNFFEISYLDVIDHLSDSQKRNIEKAATAKYRPLVVNGSYFNWELRFPFKTLGSTRAKLYVAQFLDEFHIGFTGRELSLAGNTFDFRFDAMFNSDVRNNQYIIDIIVQRIFESWAFSAFAVGPAVIITKTASGSTGITSGFINIRLKLGTSF